jgi:hypothetical protein
MNIPYSCYKAEAERLVLARNRVSLDYDSISELGRAARHTRSREVARLIKRGWVKLARNFRHAFDAGAIRRWIVAAQADRGRS